jgi:hypothetical protein
MDLLNNECLERSAKSLEEQKCASHVIQRFTYASIVGQNSFRGNAVSSQSTQMLIAASRYIALHPDLEPSRRRTHGTTVLDKQMDFRTGFSGPFVLPPLCWLAFKRRWDLYWGEFARRALRAFMFLLNCFSASCIEFVASKVMFRSYCHLQGEERIFRGKSGREVWCLHISAVGWRVGKQPPRH